VSNGFNLVKTHNIGAPFPSALLRSGSNKLRCRISGYLPQRRLVLNPVTEQNENFAWSESSRYMSGVSIREIGTE
jgi:hypothetical protein